MPRKKIKPVYFALPKDRYDCLFYPLVLAAIQERFPASEWVLTEPAKQAWSNHEWRVAWKGLRDKLRALIVWPRDNGSIGKGCYDEIRDCEFRNVPVFVVDDEGCFFELGEVLPRCLTHPKEKSDWRNYAVVRPGAKA